MKRCMCGHTDMMHENSTSKCNSPGCWYRCQQFRPETSSIVKVEMTGSRELPHSDAKSDLED